MPAPISILAVSSSVAAGHVGLSAIVPVLNFCGLEVIGLPTIVLSNHPGFPNCSATRIDPDVLDDMLANLDAGGMLSGVDTILSGYLPTPGHVAVVEAAIDRVRRHNPDARYICDPVLGDDPKGVYIAADAAAAIRDRLLPRADILLPNRFELAWLAGRPVDGPQDAIAAARSLGIERVIAKSIPLPGHRLAIVDIAASTSELIAVPRLENVPNGTGDMFSGLIAAGRPTASAAASLQTVIERSLGEDHLQIAAAAPDWTAPGRLIPAEESARSATLLQPGFVAGVDGCPAGWIAVFHPAGHPEQARWRIFETFAQLLDDLSGAAAIAVDIPIGLPDRSTTGGRDADRAARAVLGPRQSSVFAVPARAAVNCQDYREACAAALATSEPPRKVAKQTFHLFPKIREVDAHMTPAMQDRVVECHPEVAFWAINGETPLHEPKKVKSRSYPPGMELRRTLLENAGFTAQFLAGPDCPVRIAAPDDFLDACAAAWSAARLAAGHARRLPAHPPIDSRGLRMEIVY